MTVLADWQLRDRITLSDSDPLRLRVTPFVDHQCKKLTDGVTPCIGYGLTCFGLDIRLGRKFRRMGLAGGLCHVSPFVPPDEVWSPQFTVPEGGPVVIGSGDVLLAETWERVRVPEDCSVLVLCKSTWARCFINLNTTPLEPGWEGTVTLEIHNMAPRSVEVFAGHGIGQLQFFKGERPDVPYNRRPGGGTYQNQDGPTPAKITPSKT